MNDIDNLFNDENDENDENNCIAKENDYFIKVKGRVTRILYPKNKIVESGEWASFAFSINEIIEGEPIINKYGNISCAGNVPKLDFATQYVIHAKFDEDNKYQSYNIQFMRIDQDLENSQDKKTFLSHVLTDEQVNLLYTQLEDPFEIIKNEDIEKLLTIKGIGTAKAIKMIQRYKDTIDYSSAYVELDKYGLTNYMIDKLIINYGSPNIVIDKITNNPYLLADEVIGIGWNKADTIALNSGIPENDPKRISACITHVLNGVAEQGYSWVHPDYLFAELCDKLTEDIANNFGECMHSLHENNVIMWNEEKTKVALIKYVRLEQKIANELERLLSGTTEYDLKDMAFKIQDIEKEQGYSFSDEQLDAIKNGVNNQVSIITGAAGCGKSSSVNGIVSILPQNIIIKQTALSGRAASRMSEITGLDGFTIHRLLGARGLNKFSYTKDNQLECDLVILDETSMIGGRIFLDLLVTIPTGCKLIMLGDIEQLASIGALNLFFDMINSDLIPVKILTKIHRQAQKSAIITESQKITKKQQLIKKNWTGIETRGELQDFTLNVYEDVDDTCFEIMKYYKRYLKKGYVPNDIAVIVPMKSRGDSSVFELNEQIQDLVNPNPIASINVERLEKQSKINYRIGIGDRVICRKNNYKTINKQGVKTPIFNGNLGTVVTVNDNSMVICFDEQGEIFIKKGDFKTIHLGYANTCHSMQGSQSPIVIVGIDYSAFKLLSSNWLYTAITRASKQCVLCAQNRALEYCCKHSEVPYKQTFLLTMLDSIHNGYGNIIDIKY